MREIPESRSFFSDQFSQHPESVAERIRQRSLRAIFRGSGADEPAYDGPDWFDLTEDNTEDEWEAAEKHCFPEPPPPRGSRWLLRTARRIDSCPLVGDWKRWDMFGGGQKDFRQVSDVERERSDTARQVPLIAHRGRLKLAWCPAADAGADTLDHIHAETTVDGHRVHIDRLERTLSGPGRAWKEVRIFVDGALAGRAGRAGCSLGGGGGDLPAVARAGGSTLITEDVLHGIAFPVVELWECGQ